MHKNRHNTTTKTVDLFFFIKLNPPIKKQNKTKNRDLRDNPVYMLRTTRTSRSGSIGLVKDTPVLPSVGRVQACLVQSRVTKRCPVNSVTVLAAVVTPMNVRMRRVETQQPISHTESASLTLRSG